jgi:hypothetical protein
MNIMDASNKLFEFFLTNDCFVVDKNLKDIVTVTDDPERDKACIIGALGTLKTMECVTPVEMGQTTYWFLNRPAESLEQELKIHGFTAQMIAECINSFCQLIEDPTDLCDAKSLQEKDIRNLLFITNYFITAANGGDNAEKGVDSL